MALETGTYISDLVATNPTATDDVSEGDDHIRLLKSTITATFPNITGAVSATHTAIDNATTQVPTLDTVQATTSGTAFDFTGIPSWVTKIEVMFDQVSLDSTDDVMVQIGDSIGIKTTGYESQATYLAVAPTVSFNSTTSGFPISNNSTNGVQISGILQIMNITGNVWIAAGTFSKNGSSGNTIGGGRKTLTGALTQLRVTRVGATNFDNGQVNIRYS